VEAKYITMLALAFAFLLCQKQTFDISKLKAQGIPLCSILRGLRFRNIFSFHLSKRHWI